VIAVHTAGTTRLPWGTLGPFDYFVWNGALGVDLFFALSGFLVTTLIVREEGASIAGGGGQRFNIARFYLRRTLRILPPFYLVMGLLMVASDHIPFFSTATPSREIRAEAPGALFSILTFWWNYYCEYVHRVAVGEAFSITWSLCVEEHFYLLWPALLLVVKARRRRIMAAAAICFVALLGRYLGVAAQEAPSALRSLTHYRLDAILWGALGALWREGGTPWPRLRRAALGLSSGLVMLLVARGDIFVHPYGTALGLHLGQSVVSVCFTLFVLEVAETPRSLLTRALEIAPLAWMGRVSYGMYLLHSPAIDLARMATLRGAVSPSPWHFLLTYGVTAALTVGLATVMFLVWERPFQTLRARLRPRSTGGR
jgi:peptidoglycan/LPS O-acetylase OafA/YrhL